MSMILEQIVNHINTEFQTWDLLIFLFFLEYGLNLSIGDTFDGIIG